MLQLIQWIGVAYRLAQFKEWSCWQSQNRLNARGKADFEITCLITLWVVLLSVVTRNWRVNGFGSHIQTGIQFEVVVYSEIDITKIIQKKANYIFKTHHMKSGVPYLMYLCGSNTVWTMPTGLEMECVLCTPFGVRDASKRRKTSEGVANKEKSLFKKEHNILVCMFKISNAIISVKCVFILEA